MSLPSMPEFNPGSDPALGAQLHAIEQPYLTELEGVNALPSELIKHVYDLGIAAGAAMMNAQIAHQRGLKPAAETVESIHLGHKWRPREGLKIINGAPVASTGDMVEFERDELGKPPRMGASLRRILITNQFTTDDEHPIAVQVRDATRIYGADELPWKPGGGEGVSPPQYIDLLGMLSATKILLTEWRGKSRLETGIDRLNTGTIRYMTLFLNHSLQLDPPLESY